MKNSSKEEKPSTLVRLLAILFSLPIMASQFFAQYATMGFLGGIGGLIGALIPALIIVLLFQISTAFRNAKSR